jgi:hypothetical protein
VAFGQHGLTPAKVSTLRRLAPPCPTLGDPNGWVHGAASRAFAARAVPRLASLSFELPCTNLMLRLRIALEGSATYKTNLALEIDEMFILDGASVALIARDGQHCSCCSRGRMRGRPWEASLPSFTLHRCSPFWGSVQTIDHFQASKKQAQSMRKQKKREAKAQKAKAKAQRKSLVRMWHRPIVCRCVLVGGAELSAHPAPFAGCWCC